MRGGEALAKYDQDHSQPRGYQRLRYALERPRDPEASVRSRTPSLRAVRNSDCLETKERVCRETDLVPVLLGSLELD